MTDPFEAGYQDASKKIKDRVKKNIVVGTIRPPAKAVEQWSGEQWSPYLKGWMQAVREHNQKDLAWKDAPTAEADSPKQSLSDAKTDTNPA